MSHIPQSLDIAYIGGGSRGWAWKLMADLALEPALTGRVRLYDIDQEAARLNERIGNRLSARPDVKGKWRYEVRTSLKEALEGVDVVIISIMPGTFKEMEVDVHAPEAFGIYQSVGDTTGPGGLFRALRTIPLYEEFAQAIETWAPAAWVINYTNPMAICVRTLYEVFPGVKAFGCCHEVFGTQELLASMAAHEGLVQDPPHRREIHINVLGLNHCTWIDRASFRDVDLLPMYRRFAERHREEGFETGGERTWENDYFTSAHKVKFDLFLRFGLIAAAGDRHLAEFFPASWYLKDPETVRSWKFSLTPVSWRVENQKSLEARARRLASGEEEVELAASGEEGVLMLKAIAGVEETVSNVNLPNRGQIANLPPDTVVETNALFRYDSVQPVQAGALPSSLLAFLASHAAQQETILRAGLQRDPELAFRAFCADPLAAHLSPSEAERLFSLMLERLTPSMPGW
ncbi:glucosidase [Spirochaeta thermophila]|uniref:Hydrolytic enzyme n=1 Tax=Winmispira thermophila (strain ATCC 49972 / DSM 6192 / RI 19.B1) TaxID=665571 RepID=E0RRY0_WINT6|nr:glucosidase [Spirochaeta thermophila]ADN01767.1 hydrolytic enzyme [Spirochaeta thermophila DSM 6192]